MKSDVAAHSCRTNQSGLACACGVQAVAYSHMFRLNEPLAAAIARTSNLLCIPLVATLGLLAASVSAKTAAATAALAASGGTAAALDVSAVVARRQLDVSLMVVMPCLLVAVGLSVAATHLSDKYSRQVCGGRREGGGGGMCGGDWGEWGLHSTGQVAGGRCCGSGSFQGCLPALLGDHTVVCTSFHCGVQVWGCSSLHPRDFHKRGA